MTMNGTLQKLIEKNDLTNGEASSLMSSMMLGELSPPQTAAVLTALRMKGETVGEITGFAEVMREKAVHVSPRRSDLVDTCGTGGDSKQTFNVSTATAFVAAAMGIPIAKHGNRAISSQCGSADVLEELGARIDLEPDAVAELIDRVGIGFLFAPAHHPAMKHVAPVRKEMGVRTVFNLLGPLTNPALVRRQLVGVYRQDLTETVARVLQALGSEKVIVVHGADGTDEVSISGETIVSILGNGTVHTTVFRPEDAGVPRAKLDQISGGTVRENARHLLDVLGGQRGPRRDCVVLNAAFVALVADRVKSIAQGAGLARDTIDSGAAMDVLENFRKTSQTLGNGNGRKGAPR